MVLILITPLNIIIYQESMRWTSLLMGGAFSVESEY